MKKNKLRELELDSKKKSNYIPKFKALTNISKKTKTQKESFKEKFFGYLISGSIIAIIIFNLIHNRGWSTLKVKCEVRL